MKTLLIAMLCAFGLPAFSQVMVNGNNLRDGTNSVNAVTIVGNSSGQTPFTIYCGTSSGGDVWGMYNPLGEALFGVDDNGVATLYNLANVGGLQIRKRISDPITASGSITVTNNPATGDTLIVSDGVYVYTVTFDTDVIIGADAPNTTTNLYQWLNQHLSLIVVSQTSPTNISLQNQSFGTGGNIPITTTSTTIGVSGMSGGTSPNFTLGSTLTNALSTNATINFGNTTAGSVTDVTTTLNTVGINGDWSIQVTPSKTVMDGTAKGTFTAWVSATNTITVRFENASTGAVDPPSGGFRITATQWSP